MLTRSHRHPSCFPFSSPSSPRFQVKARLYAQRAGCEWRERVISWRVDELPFVVRSRWRVLYESSEEDTREPFDSMVRSEILEVEQLGLLASPRRRRLRRPSRLPCSLSLFGAGFVCSARSGFELAFAHRGWSVPPPKASRDRRRVQHATFPNCGSSRLDIDQSQ